MIVSIRYAGCDKLSLVCGAPKRLNGKDMLSLHTGIGGVNAAVRARITVLFPFKV
jgi:hypothetical protein